MAIKKHQQGGELNAEAAIIAVLLVAACFIIVLLCGDYIREP